MNKVSWKYQRRPVKKHGKSENMYNVFLRKPIEEPIKIFERKFMRISNKILTFLAI